MWTGAPHFMEPKEIFVTRAFVTIHSLTQQETEEESLLSVNWAADNKSSVFVEMKWNETKWSMAHRDKNARISHRYRYIYGKSVRTVSMMINNWFKCAHSNQNEEESTSHIKKMIII